MDLTAEIKISENVLSLFGALYSCINQCPTEVFTSTNLSNLVIVLKPAPPIATLGVWLPLLSITFSYEIE